MIFFNYCPYCGSCNKYFSGCNSDSGNDPYLCAQDISHGAGVFPYHALDAKKAYRIYPEPHFEYTTHYKIRLWKPC
jgi:hypothetical protein